MPDQLIANSRGMTYEQMKMPSELLSAAQSAGFGEDDAAVLEFLDKYVLALDLDSFSSDLWLEGEMIRVNLFPPEGRVHFAPKHPTAHPELFHPKLERVGNQLNWCVKRLLKPDVYFSKTLCPFHFYWSLKGSKRAPCRDSHHTRAHVDLSGVDLFDIYLDQVYNTHRWKDRVIEMLKRLDDILQDRQPDLVS